MDMVVFLEQKVFFLLSKTYSNTSYLDIIYTGVYALRLVTECRNARDSSAISSVSSLRGANLKYKILKYKEIK
jgi:hypothetical protein